MRSPFPLAGLLAAALFSLPFVASCELIAPDDEADAGAEATTSDDESEDDAGTGDEADAGSDETGNDPLPPGAACDCDDDCQGNPFNPGLCVLGVCMQESNGECASAGTTEGCPAGSRCWGLQSAEGGICWPDCDAHTCDGTCDGDGSCVPDDTSTCDFTCSEFCPEPPPPECETEEDCGAGLICTSDARCVLDLSSPPEGPAPSCNDGPHWECVGDEAYCGALVPFEPVTGDGYWNYPLNGETNSNQWRSFIRRDVMMLIKYATYKVDCLAEGWPGNGGLLGLGDMSEENGDIPGTATGNPGHPEGTHVNGHDMDIGYYQVNTADNILRPVCDHVSGGADQYHCTSAPYALDAWRTALFIAILHDSPNLRVIGVDGRIGPAVLQAASKLCQEGWIGGPVCSQGMKLAYEEEDQGYGWYYFHHHHLHVSVSAPAGLGFGLSPHDVTGPDGMSCFAPGCGSLDVSDDPRRSWTMLEATRSLKR